MTCKQQSGILTDLKLARNEASHERVTALEIEIDVMKADKNVLESQTAEQRVAAYALKPEEKEAEEEAKRAAKVVERNRKRAEKEAKEAAVAAAAAVKRKAFVEYTECQPSCIRLCRHVGCGKSVFARGVCKGHGPRCSHVGCSNDVYARSLQRSWPEVQARGMRQKCPQ